MPIIKSNQITFIDITDSRKLDVYITSNLPTTQIYNVNTGAYSPDWEDTNLHLNASVYLDSEEITPTTIQWYTKINGVETGVDTNSSLLISTNVLSNNPIITYICRATYEGLTAFQEITFMRTDTGINGSNGKDGTSVTILGSYNTVAELQSAHPIGNAGDAYIVDGDLYVWAVDDSQWQNVGNIQGPKGDQGESAKAIILNASAQVFKVDKENVLSPTSITVTAYTFNTTVNSWAYSVDGGQTFQSTAPTGVSRNDNTVIISGSGFTSNSLVIRASDGQYGDTLTIYKVFDGLNGDDGSPAPTAFLTNENITFSANAKGQIAGTTFTTNVVAYMGTTRVTPVIGTITGLPNGITVASAILNNELILTFTIANNATLGSEANNNGTITIPVTSPINTNLKLNWSKVNSGADGAEGKSGADAYTVVLTNASHTFAGDVANAIASTASTQVIAYKGSASQSVTIVSVNGMNASTNDTATGIVGLNFKCSALSGTSPTITFTCTTDFKSASGSIPVVLSVGGLTFTKMFTYSIAFKGEPGEIGPAGTSASSYWLISSANVVQKTSTGTISVTPSTLTFTAKSQTGTEAPIDYAGRWAIAYSNDGISYTNLYVSTTNETSKSITVATTYKAIRARMYLAGGTTTLLDEQIIPVVSDGARGNDGVGVNSVTVTYGVSTSASTQPTSWQNSIPAVADGSYLWTRTVIDYTDDTIPDTVTLTYAKQGVKGDTGSQGSSVTVSSVQYQSGTSPTTAPTSTWSNSVVSVAEGDYLWTKTTFSDNKVAYGVARQGIDGEKGDTGRGISSIVEQYYQSTSATAQSGGSWSATVPTWADGKYIWTRSVITYTDSTTSTTSPVCVTGQKGGTGGIGATGVGVSSVDVWYYQSTSATALSGGSWSTTAPTWADGKYIWTKTITTYTNNTTDETNAVCITGQKGDKGDQGIQGIQGERGERGIQGPQGVDGKTSYFHIKYSTNANGNPMTETPSTYIGTYVDYTEADSTDYTKYTWSRFIGSQGEKGDQGIAGTNGVDGQTSYLHIAYATSSDGKTGFSVSDSVGKTYIGQYTDHTQADSTDSTKYKWTLIKGDKGNDGVGIASTTVTYGVSDSSSTQPTSWQSTIPTVADGKYLWTRTVIDYTDTAKADTVSYTYAKQGTKGDMGSAGSSVTVTSIQYQEGTSATTAPTGTWSNSVVSVADGKYLWTKTVFSDGKTAYGVAKQGSSGVSAVTFQIYAPNGYLLTKDLSEITLQTFAYEGSNAITSSATYQWAQYIEGVWENISGATAQTLTVTKDEVVKSKSYKCIMTYKSKQYTTTATVQDKTDIYDSLIQVITKYSPANKLYWVLYSTVYSEEGERDALLGSVSATAPINPTAGQYWYKIDETNYTVTLMKYSGTAWAETTDKQELAYDWSLLTDTNKIMSLGSQNKVKIITSSDFSKTCSVQCNIHGSESMPISYSNQILIDPSDPIVASVEPDNPTHGQLWIKTGTNGLYTLLVWDASLEQWVVSETDSQVKVHISKPTSYEVGDVWVVGGDYEPTIYINGVAQTTKHLSGTMLKAQYSSQSYKDSDWVEALNYKKEIDSLKAELDVYNQFFDFDDDGLTMYAKNKNGVISEFKTKLTNTELGFYQGENKVAHINNNQLNISKAEITNGMTITGNAPVLEIGNFTIIQESNGSLSIGLKS